MQAAGDAGLHLHTCERPARLPGLGTTYEGYDPALLERVLPLVDYIETTPDSIAVVRDGRVRLHEPSVKDLQGIGPAAQILLHGVGLSIGSASGWSDTYLELLEMLLARLPVAWHSEHLGYTRVDGEALGTMLALPRTERVLDMLCERVQRIQERFPLPFLLENIVHMLPDYPGEYSEAGFLNALTERTGCGLVLDVYNLECDAHNGGFDIDAFLQELNVEPVVELHVACGTEFQGRLLDAHARPTRESTLGLAQRVVGDARGTVEVVTFELLREAVAGMGHRAIVGELTRLRNRLCRA